MFSTVEPMLSQWSGHRSPDRSAPTESCSAFRAKRYRQRRADRPPSRAASRRNAAGCRGMSEGCVAASKLGVFVYAESARLGISEDISEDIQKDGNFQSPLVL